MVFTCLPRSSSGGLHVCMYVCALCMHALHCVDLLSVLSDDVHVGECASFVVRRAGERASPPSRLGPSSTFLPLGGM
jgi:hypothetical protein